MRTRTIQLPVFSPNRFEEGSTVSVLPGTIWSVSEDTTYQYNTMNKAMPIKAGLVRGVPDDVSQVTFGQSVFVEIQE